MMNNLIKWTSPVVALLIQLCMTFLLGFLWSLNPAEGNLTIGDFSFWVLYGMTALGLLAAGYIFISNKLYARYKKVFDAIIAFVVIIILAVPFFILPEPRFWASWLTWSVFFLSYITPLLWISIWKK